MSLEPLHVLVGTWGLSGRSPDAETDDVSGRLDVRPILGGHVLELRGTIRVGDVEVESLELVWADPAGGFRSHVYSAAGAPTDYRWDRVGDTLVHIGSGATYTGTITDDGDTISGGWRPDPGQPAQPGSTFDATMRRLGPGEGAA
jgi:hypothetical protein